MPSPLASDRRLYTAAARASARAGTRDQRPMPKPPTPSSREAVQASALQGLKTTMRRAGRVR